MPLTLIGAGFGRTGTDSIRQALEHLGLPCYHMKTLMFDPAHRDGIDFWARVADSIADSPADGVTGEGTGGGTGGSTGGSGPAAPGRGHDWASVLAPFRAVVDFPASACWRALMAAYPQARVLLSVHPRGAAAWYDSARATIYTGTDQAADTPFGQKFNAMMDRLVWQGMLQGCMEDRDRAIARYEAHIAEVRAAVPPGRLLVYSVDQGWAPLCGFLGLPVPDAPFPQVNSRDAMSTVMDRLERSRRLRRS